MLKEWRDFMVSCGARFENASVHDFGEPEREAAAASSGNVITDLSSLTVVKVSGTDAATFLDEQFTSDVARLTDGSPQISAWCNPNGQVIATFVIVRFGDEYSLLLPTELAEVFVDRLGSSVARSDVTLEDCRRTFQCIGYKHGDDNGMLGAEIARRLSSQERAISLNGLVMLHIPVNWNRVIIFGPPRALEVAWWGLVQVYSRIGSRYWQSFDIVDGLPWILNATTESLLPQALNLDLLQGLSLGKRRFAGQEAIARLHDGGRCPRRLFVVSLATESPPQPGAKLYAADRSRGIGHVVNTSTHSGREIHALVTLDIDHADVEALELENRIVRMTKIASPPYSRLSEEFDSRLGHAARPR